MFYLIFKTFHYSVATSGCLLNFCLLFIAIFKTPKAIRSYSTLIINVAATDFSACFVDLFTQQRQITAGFTLGYTSQSFCKYFGPRFCFLMYSLELHFLSHSLWLLLFGFSYRYYILFYPQPSIKKLMLIICIIYIPSLIQWTVLLTDFDDPKIVKQIVMKAYPEYDFKDEDVYGTINTISFPTLYTILHMTLPIYPVYATIIILRRRIIRKLECSTIEMSKRTKSMHEQLLKALTYQACIPLCYTISVTSYAISTIYPSPIFEHINISAIVLMPALAPLCSLLFIRLYRDQVIHWFWMMTGQTNRIKLMSSRVTSHRTEHSGKLSTNNKF